MNDMTRDEVIEQAALIGWHAVPCALPDLIALRAYKSEEPNERMRLSSNGAMYTLGDDGWMYQIGTVKDVANAIKARGNT
jgi:hypothetical protein